MMTEETKTVHTELVGNIFMINIDRSDKMNAMTPDMFEEMSEAYQQLEDNPDAWVALVTFAGDHMTAGLDLPKFQKPFSEGKLEVTGSKMDPFGLRSRTTKPIVMAVQGYVFTIGLELLLAADIVVAADDTVMQQLEPKRGIAVFGGANFRYIDRCGWGNAMYHLLRADKITAERALQIGFVQEVVPAGQQRERAKELAEEVAAVAPLAAQWIKKANLAYVEAAERPAIDLIPDMMRGTANTEDAMEGVRSFMAKEPPKFKGR